MRANQHANPCVAHYRCEQCNQINMQIHALHTTVVSTEFPVHKIPQPPLKQNCSCAISLLHNNCSSDPHPSTLYVSSVSCFVLAMVEVGVLLFSLGSSPMGPSIEHPRDGPSLEHLHHMPNKRSNVKHPCTVNLFAGCMEEK